MSRIRSILAIAACILTFTTGQAVQIRKTPGSRIPEYILPTDRDNPALWKGSSSPLRTRAVPPGSYANNDVPRTGNREYVLVLVDFKDHPFLLKDTVALRERYNRMFNEKGYTDTTTYSHKGILFKGQTGSVSEYFHDQSYGKFTPTFRIAGPIHPSQGYAYYGQGDDYRIYTLVQEICDSLTASGEIDLAEYTRNGNIDQLSIIYSGRGENYSGSDPYTIWPQASILDYNKNGINEIKFACTCEIYWDSDSIIDGIGTFCHEFSHTLGLPDFYNTSSSSDSETNAAMGFWSIMDYGCYENEGFSPVGYTAFEKYSLGWMDLEEIQGPGKYYLHDISCEPDPDTNVYSAFRLSTGQDDNFIILENHIKSGWYKYHATQGLMVTSVSYYYNSWIGNTVNSVKSDKHYHILPADNDYSRYSNSGDLFPYQDIDSITTQGMPELTVGTSIPLYSIFDIKKEGDVISFTARSDNQSGMEIQQATDISINVGEGYISVDAPIGSRLSVHEISGRSVIETVITKPHQTFSLSAHGIWIVKCGDTVRKIQK